MSADIRPTLTARWRALERKGWKFWICNRYISNRLGQIEDRVVLGAYHPNGPAPHYYSVSIPLAEYEERNMLDMYEFLFASSAYRPTTHTVL